jgi:Ca-activated chloride channel family protein
MRIRSVALWSVLGIVASTAAALAIPLAGSRASRAPARAAAAPAPEARFTATGRAITLDARLGNSVLATGGGETYLLASLVGADTAQAAAPPVNLAIVIDRSGSMKGERIARAMEAAAGIVDRLREEDSVTLVSFDTEAQVVFPATHPTAAARSAMNGAIRAIRLGGDTCISCGIEEAMAQLSLTNLGGDRVNRIILLSDGATNHGIRDLAGIRAMSARMRDRGCSITTIGVDVEFDEKVMTAIADESNGRHYFVANAADLPRIFSTELDSLFASVARDAELALDLAPGVEVDQVFDRSFRREGSRVVVPFGTFGAKTEKTTLIKLRVPADAAGAREVAHLRLTYRDLIGLTDESAAGALAVTVKDGAADDLDPWVAARIERSRTAQTLSEANILFEQGRVAEAKNKLTAQLAENSLAEQKAKEAEREPARHAAPFGHRPVERDFEEQNAPLERAKKQLDKSLSPPPAPAAAPSPVAGRPGKGLDRSDPWAGDNRASRKESESSASELRK